MDDFYPGQTVYYNDPDDPTQSDYAQVINTRCNVVRIQTDYGRIVDASVDDIEEA